MLLVLEMIQLCLRFCDSTYISVVFCVIFKKFVVGLSDLDPGNAEIGFRESVNSLKTDPIIFIFISSASRMPSTDRYLKSFIQ